MKGTIVNKRIIANEVNGGCCGLFKKREKSGFESESACVFPIARGWCTLSRSIRLKERLVMPLQGILFDLDGTLLDTRKVILASMRHATKTVLGKKFSDTALMSYVGQPLEAQMPHFTDDPALQEEMLSVYRAHNHRIHDEGVKAFPGTAETLRKLRDAGFRLGVVTSKRHALAQRGLDVCGLADYVEFVVGPDDFPAHKPDPGPVRYGCELLNLPPETCLYVGDSPFDMQAGNAAGCTTVAVLWGMFSREALEAQHPDHLISRLSDLEAIAKGPVEIRS